MELRASESVSIESSTGFVNLRFLKTNAGPQDLVVQYDGKDCSKRLKSKEQLKYGDVLAGKWKQQKGTRMVGQAVDWP